MRLIFATAGFQGHRIGLLERAVREATPAPILALSELCETLLWGSSAI